MIMKEECVQKVIKKTALFNKLSKYEKLVFVGYVPTINYLKKNLISSLPNQKDSNCYCALKNTFEKKRIDFPDDISSYQAIIVVSETDEHSIFNTVKEWVDQLLITIPILKLFSDVFVNMMTGNKLLEVSEYKFKKPSRSYAILTTPRSGSTLLCELLKSTNLAGFPAEHLRRESEILTKNSKFDSIKYLEKLMTYLVTDNRIFGTKFISHFLKGHQEGGLDLDKTFHQYIHKIIFLRREDKLAQVVSIFMAQTTGYWHSYQIKNKQKYQEILSNIDVKNINLQDLNFMHKGLIKGDNYLQNIIDNHQIEAFYVTYEQLLEEPEIHLIKILDYLGIEPPANINLTTRTKKLRSGLTQEIIDRYLEKYNTLGEKKWD